jgi:hypothetical protein
VHFPIESGRDEAITTEGQGINNWTMVSTILSYQSGQSMPIIFITGYGDIPTTVHAIRISRAMGANIAPNKSTTHTMVPTDTIV